jgi:IclR family transcriptional regulator, mhp operon transcriptional activator
MATDDRILRVIRAANELGACTVLDLHRATGISRAAVYRVIENLCRHGYVRRIPKDSRFRLTAEIRKLSSGYREDAWIVDVGAPVIARLQQEFRWPTSLATPDKDKMIVRETTRYRSPFVFDTGNVGMHLPILCSSLGLAYLSLCSPRTRQITLALLRQSTHPDDQIAMDRGETERLLRNTARRGYGYRQGGITANTSSISVPLSTEREVAGSICITFATSVVSQREALAQFLPALRQAAAEIVAHVETDPAARSR